MKKILLSLMIVPLFLSAQNKKDTIKDTIKDKIVHSALDKISLENLQIPSNSALNILGKSPSEITTVDISHKLDISSFNFGNNSIEYRPAKIFNKGKSAKLKDIYGYYEDEEGKLKNTKPFRNARYFTLSLANVYSDTLSSIGFGFRANLITINNTKRMNAAWKESNTHLDEILDGCDIIPTKKIESIVDSMEKCMKGVEVKNCYDKLHKEELLKVIGKCQKYRKNKDDSKNKKYCNLFNEPEDEKAFKDLETCFSKKSNELLVFEEEEKSHLDRICMKDFLQKHLKDSDPYYANIKDELEEEFENKCIDKKILDTVQVFNNFSESYNQKLFTFDIASAYSINFDQNKIQNQHAGRLAFWATQKLSIPSKKHLVNTFNLYAFQRFMKDFQPIDPSSKSEPEYFDIGAKLEFQSKCFSISAEYINRMGDDEEYRLTGMLQYQLNETFYLTGSFGKSLEKQANLISLFGIQWGFENKKKED